MRSALAICALVAFVVACASVTQEPAATTPTYVIEVAVLNLDGWPIAGAVLSTTEGDYVEVLLTGVVDLHVTGPVRLVAWRVGHAVSEPVWCLPGPCRITLYPARLAND